MDPRGLGVHFSIGEKTVSERDFFPARESGNLGFECGGHDETVRGAGRFSSLGLAELEIEEALGAHEHENDQEE